MKKWLHFNHLQQSIDSILKRKDYFLLFVTISITIRLLFFISDGHNSDFDFFEHWADRMLQHGFTQIYSIQVDRFECDYPPLYLYVLNGFGHFFTFMNWPIHTHFFDTFLKLFNLICELTFLNWFYKKTQNKLFLFLMLCSPTTILNAYGWGQIDIIYTILLFTIIWFLTQRKVYSAALWLGLSLTLKTQTLLFLPIIGLLFFQTKVSPRKKIIALVLLILVFIIPNLPFILYAPNPMDSINPHLTAAGRYNYIAVNAFNLYWTLWADFALKLKLQFPPNDLLVLGFITRKALAYTIFGILYLFILGSIIQKNNGYKKLFVLMPFFCFSYFMFLPEMHERYLFPFFIFSAFLTTLDFEELPYFILISLLHSANLIWGWGEQKYVQQQWIFESTRLIAFATFLVWCFYARKTWLRLNSLNSNPNT